SRDGNKCCPLVDGNARVARLHAAHAALCTRVELHDFGHAADAVTDQTREDAPLAFRPRPEVAVRRREEALGVAPRLAGSDCLAIHLDVLAGNHLEAFATEYTVDLCWCHGCTFGTLTFACAKRRDTESCVASHAPAAARNATIRANENPRAILALMLVDGCTTSTVASSLPPPCRASSTSRAQRSPSGAEVRRTRAISPAAAC